MLVVETPVFTRRICELWDKEPETVYLLFVYEKTKQADLTPQQATALGRLIREELKSSSTTSTTWLRASARLARSSAARRPPRASSRSRPMTSGRFGQGWASLSPSSRS